MVDAIPHVRISGPEAVRSGSLLALSPPDACGSSEEEKIMAKCAKRAISAALAHIGALEALCCSHCGS